MAILILSIISNDYNETGTIAKFIWCLFILFVCFKNIITVWFSNLLALLFSLTLSYDFISTLVNTF